MANFEPFAWQLNELVTELGSKIKKVKTGSLVVDSSNPENISTNVETNLFNYYKSRLSKIVKAPVFGEESGDILGYPEDSSFWMVDVIDGTLSYLDGYPGYVTQVCFMSEGLPQFSAVYAPETDELFHAIRGFGAFCNKSPLKVSNSIRKPIFIDNTPVPNSQLREIMERFDSRSYIESGSIGLKICRIATGEADIFIKKSRVFDWDVAPGGLILTEAGGYYRTFSEDPYEFSKNFRKENFLAFGKKMREVVQILWNNVN
jgi:3'(2'), 5'-bisphosphate nucleotidase